MKNDLSLDFLKTPSLMQGMTEEELEKILPFFVRVEVDRNETVIEEGEASFDLYLIAEGEVTVLKWDEAKLFQLPLETLEAGEIFGDMSFMDGSLRSTTVETNKGTLLYRLARDKISPVAMKDIYNKMIANIIKINSERIRVGNQAQVKAVRSSLHHQQVKIDLLFILLILAILFAIFSSIHFLEHLPEWGYWILLVLPTFYMIRKFHFTLEMFGIGKNKLKKTMKETPFFILGGFFLVVMGFKFFPHFMTVGFLPPQTQRGGMILYLFYSVAYEFIGRGVIQTSLQQLFGDEEEKKAVFITSTFMTFAPLFSYSTFHWEAFLLTFIANFLLGLIYLRHKNVAGVALIHFVTGLFASRFA